MAQGLGSQTILETFQARFLLSPNSRARSCGRVGSGDYRCVVANGCWSVTTETVHVTITSDVAPNICFTTVGDKNTGGSVNVFDIPNFVGALLCKPLPDFLPADRADVSLGGKKDGLDIAAFLDAMMLP